jgi:hypothetical protein
MNYAKMTSQAPGHILATPNALMHPESYFEGILAFSKNSQNEKGASFNKNAMHFSSNISLPLIDEEVELN